MSTNEPLSDDPWFVVRNVFDQDAVNAAVDSIAEEKKNAESKLSSSPEDWTVEDPSTYRLRMTTSVQKLCTYVEQVSGPIHVVLSPDSF